MDRQVLEAATAVLAEQSAHEATVGNVLAAYANLSGKDATKKRRRVLKSLAQVLSTAMDEAARLRHPVSDDEAGADRRSGSTRKRRRAATATTTSDKPAEKKKKAKGGLQAVCQLSAEMADLLGEQRLPRTQVVKGLWKYIKENDLQNPQNRRQILCDAKLEGVFGVKRTDMFKMQKLVTKHCIPLKDLAN